MRRAACCGRVRCACGLTRRAILRACQVHTALVRWSVCAAVWVYDEAQNTVIVMCAQSPTHRSVVAALPEGDSQAPTALYTQQEFITTILPAALQARAPTVLVTCVTGEDELTHTEQQVRCDARCVPGPQCVNVTVRSACTASLRHTSISVLRLSTKRSPRASQHGLM